MHRVASACATLLACAWLAAACTGREGTIGISVLAAPDSDLLETIERLQITYTGKNEQVSAARDDDGTLSLILDLEADGTSGDLVVEGFDAAGDRIAVGRVGPLPLAALDAELAVFLAPPLSITQAPVSLDTPRSHIGGTEASFGAFLAGGQGANGPVSDIDVYNTYLHETQRGLPLPEPRSDMAVTTGSVGFIYLMGGLDADGEASADSYAFDTRTPPAGSYRPFVIDPDFARSGSTTAVVGQEQFLVSGDPALLLDGTLGTVRELPDGEGLAGPCATVVADNRLQVIFGGAGVSDPQSDLVGAAVFELDSVTHLEAPTELLRSGHRALTLYSEHVLFVGGRLEGEAATNTAVVYEPISQSFEVIDFLATARNDPAVAMTDRYIVVAGGEDDEGRAIGDAEVFDAFTLELVAVLPLVTPRKGVTAHSLGNGQILIAGGLDEADTPTELLGLFTPDEAP